MAHSRDFLRLRLAEWIFESAFAVYFVSRAVVNLARWRCLHRECIKIAHRDSSLILLQLSRPGVHTVHIPSPSLRTLSSQGPLLGLTNDQGSNSHALLEPKRAMTLPMYSHKTRPAQSSRLVVGNSCSPSPFSAYIPPLMERRREEKTRTQ
jgi:hypothetical protein